MTKQSPNSLELRRQLRQLLLDGLRHPLHHRHHRGRRGGGIAAARREAKGTPCNATDDNLTVRLGPPVLPDYCTAPGRVLVISLHYCSLHGWTARMQGDNSELSAAAAHSSYQATPHRTPSPTYSSETPPYTPTPLELPGFELPRTMAARRGALPFYNNGVSSSMAAQVGCPHLRHRRSSISLASPSWLCPPTPTSTQPRASLLSFRRGGDLGAVGVGDKGAEVGDPAT